MKNKFEKPTLEIIEVENLVFTSGDDILDGNVVANDESNWSGNY